MTLVPYLAYRRTEIPWLARIPTHWRVLSGRSVIRVRRTSSAHEQALPVLSLSYGQIVVKPQDRLHGLVPESFATYQIIDPGDIVCRPTDLQNDKNSLRFGISQHRGIITSAYMCLQAQPDLVRRHAYYLLHAYDVMKVFYGLGSGLRQNLEWKDFKWLPCVVPPIDEQAAIVRYLDHFDRRIRKAIRAKTRLIALLQEEKQAIIHRAVTRGLDPDVPLKPSGVEWLGDVPAHWEVKRQRNLALLLVSGVDKRRQDDEVPVRLCNYVDVYKHDRITGSLRFMRATASLTEVDRFGLREGDVLITKDSEMWNDIGVPALVQYTAPDLVCGYHLGILRPREGLILGAYLFWAHRSPRVAVQYHVAANGITRYGLTHDAIKSIQIPLPPLPEQAAIARYVDEATAGLDGAIAVVQREIALLREYRARLVADVVTGALDVRAAAAALPDEPEEAPEPADTEDAEDAADEDGDTDADAGGEDAVEE